MILSDFFLSRQKHNNSNPHEIIPVSFNMQGVLQDKYYFPLDLKQNLVE